MGTADAHRLFVRPTWPDKRCHPPPAERMDFSLSSKLSYHAVAWNVNADGENPT
jgi:hypothetical protein